MRAFRSHACSRRSMPGAIPAVIVLLLAFATTPAPAADGATTPPASSRTLAFGDARVAVEVVDADAMRTRMLEGWIDEVAGAVEAAFGRWPLARSRIRITQVDSSDSSPVPWGQTSRRADRVAVLLFVRRDAGEAALRADWTAAHELAHLYHPYLGREGRWMAEGLASYYQNVARARAGLMPAGAAWRALDAGFARGRRDTGDGPLSAARRGETMRVYWAGAAYWLEADLALRASGGSLDAVIAGYAACCLADAPAGDPAAFAAALDRVAGRALFVPLYRRYAASRSFPDLDAAYARLGLARDGGRLRFEPAGAALRDAIMAPRAR